MNVNAVERIQCEGDGPWTLPMDNLSHVIGDPTFTNASSEVNYYFEGLEPGSAVDVLVDGNFFIEAPGGNWIILLTKVEGGNSGQDGKPKGTGPDTTDPERLTMRASGVVGANRRAQVTVSVLRAETSGNAGGRQLYLTAKPGSTVTLTSAR